jgi:uncharacterized protein YkwD
VIAWISIRLKFAEIALALAVALLIPSAGFSADPDPLPPPLPPAVTQQAGTRELDYTGCGGPYAPVVNAAYEQEVVDRVNSIRAARSLPPLKRVDLLDEAARYHATDMGQDDYFSHDSYDRSGGALVLVCAWSARISTYYPGWWSLAENIAAGYATPASVMDGWMNSTGHRANILSTSNWEIGVGYYAGGGDYGSYWVQDFGRRQDVYPLIINREAATTASQDVALHIYGDWQEMRLRNDDGTWTGWQPFQSNVNWSLAPGRGDHTVWAELRDEDLAVTTSDSIYLDLPSPVLGDLPDILVFSYNLWNGRLVPSMYELVPENTGSDEPLTWQLSQEGSWFVTSAMTGTTPVPFRIEPIALDTFDTGTYSATLTVTVIDPPGTAGSPQTINLFLEVVDRPVVYTFLPLVTRGAQPPPDTDRGSTLRTLATDHPGREDSEPR